MRGIGRIPTEVHSIGQTSYGIEKDRSKLLQEWAGLAKIIGRYFFGDGQDWSEFQEKWSGLVRIPKGLCRIGQIWYLVLLGIPFEQAAAGLKKDPPHTSTQIREKRREIKV